MLRPNTLMEMGLGLGEPELDANSALTELDKGLRSPKLGEQCEAIVRFPNLFEKYPFPILINSACLKLAEVFRTSSNFLRIWVLRVCQQSERHLDKIINVDEFIRRIFSVIHSNDPVARALTLRTLGSLSGLISERKHVHHSIRVSLDSSDPVEVSAAIYAATCYAKCSKTFANSMCKKISSMVKRISTPNDLKLRLIPILKHMHHDVTIASTVQGFCQEILECYPSKEFVITTLHTMTELAAATMANLKDQVAFLLKHLEDPRLMVKLCVLEDLRYLGKKGGHLWEASDVSSLIQSVTKPDSADKMEMDDLSDESERKKIVGHTLNVIDAMTTSTAVLNCLYSPDSPLQDLLKSCFQSVDRSIKLKAIQIASSITSNWKNETLLNSSVNLLEMTAEGVDSVLKELSVTKATTKEEEKALTEDWKRCLAYGVRLCKSTPAKCDWLCSNLVDLLMNWKFSASARSSICQAIGAVGDSRPEAIQNVLPQILELLESLQGQQIQDENTVVVTLVAVVLQAHQKFVIGERVSSLIQKLLQNSNMWDRYRIARNALRYGQPGLAEKALEDLSSKVSSENLYLWLSALHNISQAEALITDTEGIPKLQPRLNRACNLYLQAVMSLKAASSPTVSMQFHIEYVKIRSEMFVAFMNFLSACGALQFSPPPAIAPTIANVSRDELLKSGRVVTQLRKSIRDFQGVADMYARLYQTAFDADNDTLENIQILQQLCRLMSYGIETLVHTKDHPSLSQQDYIFNFNESTVSTMQLFVSSCNEAMNVLKPLKPVPSAGVKNEQLEVIKEAARILIETPLPYPRFFFQNLQTTRVKIAVSPQPRAAGENVTVILGNNLALKVEGVIHQVIAGSKNQSDLVGVEAESTAKGFRRPKSIRMAVTTTPSQSTRTHSMDMNKLTPEPSTIVKEVNPHRDFFTAQFLLGSWSSGLYTVTVDTSLIDYDGRVWLTGPRATLGIRVLSEVTSQPMSSESQKVGTPTGSMPTSSNIPRPGPSGTPGGHMPQTAMGRF